MKQSKQQNSSKQQAQTQAQPKQQSQASQTKQQKQDSAQASMNEYGTLTAKQDANADYNYASSGSAPLEQKAKKYATQNGEDTLN